VAVPVGASAERTFVVARDDTAAAIGSGDLDVLGTPRLIAWCEAVTVAALASHLEPSQTTVGSRVEMEHLRAVPVGAAVTVHAGVDEVDERLVRFEVAAHDVQGAVGRGRVTRAVVDRERFLARVQRPG